MLDTRPPSQTIKLRRRRRLPPNDTSADIGQNIRVLLRRRSAPYWLLAGASLVGTCINGPLVLSLGIGVAAHQQLQQLTPQQWQQLTAVLQRRCSPRLRLWLLSAAVVMATYGATALWSDSHSLGLPAMVGAQGVLVLLLGGLLLGAVAPKPAATALEDTATPLEQQLRQLAHADPLTRLVAVRQAVRLALEKAPQAQSAGISGPAHLIDCLHLMLAQETEPMVRTAIREGLEQLRQKPQLAAGPPAVQTPLKATTASRVRRTAVEYVEP